MGMRYSNPTETLRHTNDFIQQKRSDPRKKSVMSDYSLDYKNAATDERLVKIITRPYNLQIKKDQSD